MSTAVLSSPTSRSNAKKQWINPPPGPYVETDDLPMESLWHRIQMNLLIDSLVNHLKGRDDFFAGGNMFIYFQYKQTPDKGMRGPDFFYADGVPLKKDREYWAVWDEDGHYPDVIIELASPSTVNEDRTVKKQIYQDEFNTTEYYIYDRWKDRLEGWRLNDDLKYEDIVPSKDGRMYCSKLNLWLGRVEEEHTAYQATWLRFYEEDGTVVMLPSEEERQNWLNETKKVTAQRKRADTQKKRADVLEQQARAEKERADAAERELKALKNRLSGSNSSTNSNKSKNKE